MTLSQKLAAIVMRPVGNADRERALLHLLDWLGCALAGCIGSPSRAARQVLGDSIGEAPLVGGGKTTPQDAAYLNGIPGNLLEMDDVHRRAILHPGPTVLPALLACATPQMPPEAFLDALVRGYEAVIRIGRSLGPAHYALFHNTATAGPFGAAVAAGSALSLTQDQLVSAIGNAGTVAAGLWQCRHEAVMTKQLHAAHAAHAGYMAAALAGKGFTGPATLLDGPQGFFAALCRDGDLDKVIAEPAGPWLLHEVSFKPWAACRHAHPTIDVVRLLKPEIQGRSIRSIQIRSYQDAVTFCDRPDPRNAHEARFSLQHAAAVAVLRDKPSLSDFEPAAINETALAALRRRVIVIPADSFTKRYPSHFGAAATITFSDGTSLEADVADALGDPENPLSLDEILGKAAALMESARVSQEAAQHLIATTLALPASATLEPFFKALDRAKPKLEM